MGTSYLKLRILTRFPNINCPLDTLKSSKAILKPGILPYNPFLDLLILKKILNFMGNNELLKIRQVCKLWDFESRKYLRKRLHYHKIQDDLVVSKLLKLSKNSLGFPIDSFCMKIWRMNKIHVELFNSVHSQQFLVTLKISVASNDFPNLLTNIVMLRNLKTLTIFRIPEESIESVFLTRDFSIPSSGNSVLHAPQLLNLESVSFRNANPKKRFLCNYTTFIVSFFKSAGTIKQIEFYYWSTPLTKIFRMVRLPQLHSLIVEGRTLGDTDITLLTMKKFSAKLKKLQICVDNSVKKESVKELLDSFANTLREYQIT